MKLLQAPPLGRVHRRHAANTVRHYAPWIGLAWGVYQVAQGAADPDPATNPVVQAITGGSFWWLVGLNLAVMLITALVFCGHDQEWCPRCQRHPRRAHARAARYAYTLHLAHRVHLWHVATTLTLLGVARYLLPPLGYVATGAVVAGYCWLLATHRALAMACPHCPHDLLAGAPLHAFGVTDHHGHLPPWRACLYWAHRMNRSRRSITVFHGRHTGHALHLSCTSGHCNDGITSTSSARSVQWLNQHLSRQHHADRTHGFRVVCTQCRSDWAATLP